jgi:hypothetical protein
MSAGPRQHNGCQSPGSSPRSSRFQLTFSNKHLDQFCTRRVPRVLRRHDSMPPVHQAHARSRHVRNKYSSLWVDHTRARMAGV